MTVRTQVAIIGAGPAGLFLALLLHESGIDVQVFERHSRAYVEGRVRAGVLEQSTADLMADLGIGGRLGREGLVHAGINVVCNGDSFRIDLEELTEGKAIIVYGQQEVMRDLFESAEARGIKVHFDAQNVALHYISSQRPTVTFDNGEPVECDFIAGCDGFHGISRASIPADSIRLFERIYPFGWLGVLADVPPLTDEVVYCNHPHGFALASMRSKTRSRYYLQCALDEKIENWSDDRFWDETALRFGPAWAPRLTRGPSFEKSIAPLRSFVAEPLRYGQLFLAGDAAHIVPPTGAKGLNLAVSDVRILADAIAEFYRNGSRTGIDHYSDRALARVWKAERFSWWFTKLTHRFPDVDDFERRMQIAELDYLSSSVAAQTAFAENYVGLPFN